MANFHRLSSPEALSPLKRYKRVLGTVMGALGAVTLSTAPSIDNPQLRDNTDTEFVWGGELLAATTNVQSWNNPTGGKNKQVFIDFLTDVQPDVVCGTEGLLGNKDFPYTELADRSYDVITAPTRLLPGRDFSSYGLFFLSKYTINSYEIHKLDADFDITDPAKALRPRYFVYIGIAASDGSILRIICTHLDIDEEDNKQQTSQLLSFAAERSSDGPILWLGDVNNAIVYQAIDGASSPPIRERKLFTFPAVNPRFTPDSIRVLNSSSRRQIDVIDYRTHDIGSDHLALSAIIRS